MLNYTHETSPKRCGRPEFNASFSIGFGNGLHDTEKAKCGIHVSVCIACIQCVSVTI